MITYENFCTSYVFKSKDADWYFFKYIFNEIERVQKEETRVKEVKKSFRTIAPPPDAIAMNGFKEFRSQKAVCEAIRLEHGLKKIKNKEQFSQGTLSKILDDVWYEEYVCNDRLYTFQKRHGVYAIREHTDIPNAFYELESYFKRGRVQRISDNTFAFLIEKNYYAEIKNTFEESFGSETFFSIILIDNTMIVILDETSSLYKKANDAIEGYFEECERRKKASKR